MNIFTLFAEGTAVAYTLESFVTDITSMFNGAMEMASSAMDFVVSNPISIAYIGLPLVGIGVGLLKRLINN